MRYGIFLWTATGIYREADAIRIYKRKSAADAYAYSIGGNYVVRTIH